MDGGGPRLPPGLRERRRRARAHGPDDLEVVEAAPRSPGPALEMAERRLDDAAVEAHEQQRPVGHLAGELDGARPRRRHQERDGPLRRVREPGACVAAPVDGSPAEERPHLADAGAHLGEGGGLAADRARRRVAGADHELHAAGRQLLHRLDRSREHRGVAREGVRHRGEERHSRRVRGGLAEHDERVAARSSGCRGCPRRRSRPPPCRGGAPSARASARCRGRGGGRARARVMRGAPHGGRRPRP